MALAGPNGAGKSTFFDANLARCGLPFVNADELALSLQMDAYEVAKVADTQRRQLVEQRESFVFETVFSDPVGDKLEFLKSAEKAGYAALRIYIGLARPELSDTRVAMRAAGGGHDVPAHKLVERFPRILINLRRALTEISNVWVFDNSDLESPYRLLATVESGKPVELHEPAPEWLRGLLP